MEHVIPNTTPATGAAAAQRPENSQLGTKKLKEIGVDIGESEEFDSWWGKYAEDIKSAWARRDTMCYSMMHAKSTGYHEKRRIKAIYLDFDLPDLAAFSDLGASLIPFVLSRCFLLPSVDVSFVV